MKWTAPADNTSDISFTAHGNAVNGDGSANSDDKWNKVVVTLAGDTPEGGGTTDDETPGFTLIATLAIVCLAGIATKKRRY